MRPLIKPMRALLYNMASALIDLSDSEVDKCNLVYCISVLGRDEEYTVKYTPASKRRMDIFDRKSQVES